MASGCCLFEVGNSNTGVFLVRRGKVALLVEGLPNLDRVFSAGSALGLPSTFTGNPYCLTAQALVDSEVGHVPREDFLELMRQDPTLCREATEMLTREISFIQAALAQRKRQGTRQESPVSPVATPQLVGSPSAGGPQRLQHPWTNGRRHKDRPRA